MDASERPRGQEHIPEYPKAWILIRLLQIVVSLVVFFLCIHALTFRVKLTAPLVVMIIVAAATVGVSIWLIVAQYSSPRIFNYWASLAFDFLLFVTWVVSGSVLVYRLSAHVTKHGIEDDDSRATHRDDGLHPVSRIYASTLYAVVGLAGLEFSLFIFCWLTDAIVIHRHRKAGLPRKPLEKGASLPVTRQPRPTWVTPPTKKPRTKPTRRERAAEILKLNTGLLQLGTESMALASQHGGGGGGHGGGGGGHGGHGGCDGGCDGGGGGCG